MGIIAQCSSCKTKFNLPDSTAGKKIRCKKCSGIIDVPDGNDLAVAARAPMPVSPAQHPHARATAKPTGSEPHSLPGHANHVSRPVPQQLHKPTVIPRAPQSTDESGFDSSALLEPELPGEIPMNPIPRAPNAHRPPMQSPVTEGDDESFEPEIEDPDSPLDPESDSDHVLVKLAANPGYRFSGSKELDTALPYLLMVIFFGWMITATLMSRNSGDPYLGHLRWFLYLLGYAIFVYPIMMVGMNAMSKSSRMGLPGGNWYKTFAIFCPPLAAGIALAVKGGGVELFIIGLIIGFTVSLASFMFLYRPRNTQSPTAIGVLSAYFVGAIVASMFLGIGLNKVVMSVMLNNKTATSFKESPLGGVFSWNLPELAIADQPAKSSKSKNKPTSEDQTPGTNPDSPTTEPVATDDANKPIPETTGVPMSQNPDATKPDATVPLPDPTAQSTATPATSPSTAPSPMPENGVTTTPPPTGNPPATGLIKPAVAEDIVPSPLVLSIRANDEVGTFDEIIFPVILATANNNTNVASTSILIVRQRSDNSDTIEVWSTSPLAKKATMRLAHPLGETSKYILAPKGNVVARTVEFPKKSIDLRSVETDKSIARIELSGSLGTPDLMGFVAGNQILVHWQNTEKSKSVFETLSIDTGTSTRQIFPTEFTDAPGNIALSPDSRWFAMATKVSPNVGKPDGNTNPLPASPCIGLFDLAQSRSPGKLYHVSALDESKAAQFSGIAFSTDSQKFSVLYEDGGNGLVAWFKLSDTKQAGQFSFVAPKTDEHPATPPADAGTSPTPANPTAKPGDYSGAALDVLRPTTFLIRSNTLVESDHIVGTLGVNKVIAHRTIDRDTILMVIPAADGKQKLLTCKLNVEAIFGKAIPK